MGWAKNCKNSFLQIFSGFGCRRLASWALATQGSEGLMASEVTFGLFHFRTGDVVSCVIRKLGTYTCRPQRRYIRASATKPK